MREALLAAAVTAALAAADGGEPTRVWAQLRRAYVEYLSSSPGDVEGGRAARFLSVSSVSLGAADLEAQLGEHTFAAYDLRHRSIDLDREGLKEVWLSLESAELQPERIRPFVERTASAMVHEARHAIDHEALGAGPLFREGELLACADQTLFLWRRLSRDSDYRGLRELDGELDAPARGMRAGTAGAERAAAPAGEAPRGGAWWKRPLDARRIPGFQEASRRARESLRARITSQETNDWFFARSMAGGFKAFERSLSRAGYLGGPSAFHPPFDAAAKARERVVSIRRQLEVLTFNKLPAEEKDRRASALKEALASAEEELRYWQDPAAVRRAAAYYKRELAAERRALEELR